MSERAGQLHAHFEAIYRERMQGLPIVNERLEVETIGFREFEGHDIGVLLTPWFMNLFLLAGNDRWAAAEQGSMVEFALPGEHCEFTVSHDDDMGTYLSAILFRTVADFPDQETARAVAEEILKKLFATPEIEADNPKTFSRRSLLSGMGAD